MGDVTEKKVPAVKKKVVKKKAAPKKKAAANKAATTKAATSKEVKGVFVKTAPGLKSFRRAGFAFNEHGFGIALDALDKGQLKALEDETNLVVERCVFTDEDTFIASKK